MIALESLSPLLLAQGSGLFHLTRQLATSTFVAVTVAVAVRTGAISYSELSAQVTPYAHGFRLSPELDASSLPELARLAAQIDRQAQMIGYENAFVLYTIACVLGLAVSLLVDAKRA
jgi:hypothetical protein